MWANGRPTPLEPAPAALDAGDSVWLKREDRHELGAFKWRGALPALERFKADGAEAVVTASTGNHGAASAWAAQRAGMRAMVFVPAGASRAKVARLEALGAELHQVGDDLDASKDLAREFAAEHGLAFFEDGAEPAQFDGYEAIGREIAEQLGERPARVVVPVGNGALLIGSWVAPGRADGAHGEAVGGGVVAKEAPVMALSVEAGRPVDERPLGHLRGRDGGARGGPARRRRRSCASACRSCRSRSARWRGHRQLRGRGPARRGLGRGGAGRARAARAGRTARPCSS